MPDRYWRSGPWLTFDIAALFAEGPDSPAMQEFLGLLLGTTDDMVDTDIAVALHPSFCVTSEPNSPHLSVPTMTGRLHMAQGAADQLASLEENQPLLDAVAELGERGSVDVIEGADHGFAVPGGHAYHPEGAARSYATAHTIFGEHLGSRA